MDYFGPHIFGYTIALLHSLGMIAAIHAVLTVRTAQGSIAWALSLFFIPYLTLIPYLMFGRSTFDGYIKARRQANDEMRKAVSELNWRPWVEEAPHRPAPLLPTPHSERCPSSETCPAWPITRRGC